jgi:formylglycine-generating enzyme required for sulfatase activity
MKCQGLSVIFCALLSVVSVLGCKLSKSSSLKDVGRSPGDVNRSMNMVYLRPTVSVVYKGECPSTDNSRVTRYCSGLKNLKQLSKSAYESELRRAILSLRPGGAKTPNNPALVKTLEEEMARIRSMLSGPLSPDVRKSLESKLAGYVHQLNEAKMTGFTSEEQERYDFIMQRLTSGQDVTVDEGMTNYTLAMTPFDSSSFDPLFVVIPAGKFIMGSPVTESGRNSDEGPQQQVTIAKGFELQTTEVTQKQWVAVMESNPSYFSIREHCPREYAEVDGIRMCPNNPVEVVSWEDAQKFIQKLNSRGDGYRYRLPTEAEWEYAARAGTTGPHSGDLVAMAWYVLNSGKMTHPVASKRANGWGLYDMHGNVEEWTDDFYRAYSDPPGAQMDSLRVRRGGGYVSFEFQTRSAYRSHPGPLGPRGPGSNMGSGFRLVREKTDTGNAKTKIDIFGNEGGFENLDGF